MFKSMFQAFKEEKVEPDSTSEDTGSSNQTITSEGESEEEESETDSEYRREVM